MPKRLRTQYGVRKKRGEALKITRDTLVKNPRPKLEILARDKKELKLKQGKNGKLPNKRTN